MCNEVMRFLTRKHYKVITNTEYSFEIKYIEPDLLPFSWLAYWKEPCVISQSMNLSLPIHGLVFIYECTSIFAVTGKHFIFKVQTFPLQSGHSTIAVFMRSN